jgi:flagellar basal-body rod modification protein FlgD
MLPAEISAPTAAAKPDAAPSSELGKEDFLRMLIAQLENQDPLNPQDATEFTAQLAQFSSLEQLISMREAVDALTAAQASSQGLSSVGLIGRQVLAEGASFTVDAGATPPTLAFELAEPGPVLGVEVLDANGGVVARTANLGLQPAGLTELDWTAFDRVPTAGNYTFRINQGVSDATPAQPLVLARVTGATLNGSNPVVFRGDAVTPLSAIREVRQ